MTKKELDEVLRLHEMWLNDKDGKVRADLIETDLEGANLEEANLYKADLRKTNLRKTNLFKANLCKANLCEANLRGADLREADLRGANLRGADLYKVSLYGAEGIRTFTAGRYNRLCFTYIYDNEQRWQLGCFNGNYEETLEAVEKKYGEDSHYYKMIVATKDSIKE